MIRIPPGLDITKTIYTSLRSEILDKMKFSNQLLGYKLISIGGVLGFITANSKTSSKLVIVLGVLLSIALAFAFDLAVYQNNKAIVNAGSYIKEYLEPCFKSVNRSPTLMWEEYIDKKSSRKVIYNLFESANYLVTFVLILMGGIFLRSLDPPNISYFALFSLLILEVYITILGLNKGIEKKQNKDESEVHSL